MDIWRSQSAICCSSCIFNSRRYVRAEETVTSGFHPRKRPLITATSHLHLCAAPVPKTVDRPHLNKGDVIMKSAQTAASFISFSTESLAVILLQVVFRGSRYLLKTIRAVYVLSASVKLVWGDFILWSASVSMRHLITPTIVLNCTLRGIKGL